MKAFIIFMNDEPEKVMLSDEKKTLRETKRMSDAFYNTDETGCLNKKEYKILYY